TTSTARKTAPRKITPNPNPAYKEQQTGGTEAVSIVDLPDTKRAQITEAMETSTRFTLRDGTEVAFRPVIEWSFKASQSLIMGDIVGWARGALADEDDLDTLLSQPQRDVGRIVRYFDDHMGLTLGEGDSSSPS
ncbi:hypothetical protein, partial [Nocardiopsis composta]